MRPRLLDLFCKAGGAAMGYYQAGFEVVGVDVKPQPRYPFEFIQADCLALDPGFVAGFDGVHASPPCQFATDLRHAPNGKTHPNLIPHTRALLKASGRPYVIENVEGARAHLIDPILVCGSMFDLGHCVEGIHSAYLRRHRLFETNFPLRQQRCVHYDDAPVIGVYGGHARIRAKSWGGRKTKDQWGRLGHRGAASEAMGIDWMTLTEMSEAIPPAYTEFIGRSLLAHIQQRQPA